MKKSILIFSFLFCLSLSVSSRAQAATVILDWDAVTTNSDGTPITALAGYALYQATTAFNPGGVWISTTQAADMASITKYTINGATTSYTVPELSGGSTYFFRLTARNTSGMVSGFNVDTAGADV